MKIPPGFQPMSLEKMLYHFRNDAPELGHGLFTHLQRPEEEAAALIVSMEQRGLVQFAVAPTGEPSCFVATQNEIPTAPEREFANLLVSYWDTTGKFDAEQGRIVSADIPPNMSQIFTPQGPVAVAEQVALRLWKLGLIKEEHGRLTAESKMQLYAWTQEQGICDFCSDPHPKHVVLVPDFDMFPGGGSTVPKSEGGWMACETCHTLVQTNQRTDLLRRAIEHSSGGRFTAAALEGLHRRFWKQMDLKTEAAGIGLGLLDFIEDKIAPEKTWINPKLEDKARRREAIRRLVGLTGDEMDAMERGDVFHKETAQKLHIWRKRYGLNTNSEEGKRRITAFLNDLEKPPLPPMNPHWQIALDRKVEALKYLQSKLVPVVFDGHLQIKEPGFVAMMNDLKEDAFALKAADVYSFNADTMHAILEGAQSIPHESTLKSVEIPTSRAGWFWFAEPLPVSASPISSDVTHALLWAWDATEGNDTPTIRFSAYVVDERGELDGMKGKIGPSSKWYWPITLSFHEMIALNHHMYDKAYGEHAPKRPGQEMRMGKDHHLQVIAEMSLFFLNACLWFRQTVPGTKRKIEPKLTQTPGHIERHARKRYEKEFKTAPVVHVIALRKTAVTLEEREETTPDGKRHITVRHVVRGHARLQPCGPGRTERKLIWIDPYVKGPDDAPFKESGPRVFAVIR